MTVPEYGIFIFVLLCFMEDINLGGSHIVSWWISNILNSELEEEDYITKKLVKRKRIPIMYRLICDRFYQNDFFDKEKGLTGLTIPTVSSNSSLACYIDNRIGSPRVWSSALSKHIRV